MSGAIFAETQLRDVVVEDAKLDLANFRFAKLSNVKFSHCMLAEADFGTARLENVTFESCDLTAADFFGASLHKVDLRGAAVASLKGILGLKGAIVSYDQMIILLPELAAALGIDIKKD